MKIVTYYDHDCNGPFAMTAEEFKAAAIEERNSWDEWVWQDQATKDAAIERHETAFAAWHADNEASRPIKDTY